jgi:hypothetical protein
LSYFIAVAENIKQRPDRFHARRRRAPAALSELRIWKQLRLFLEPLVIFLVWLKNFPVEAWKILKI